MQPLSSDLSYNYFDPSAPVHDWTFPIVASPLFAYAAAERFTLAADSGFVDSVKIAMDGWQGDTITVLLDPDTLFTTQGGAQFHFVNIFSSSVQRFAGVTIPVSGAGQGILNVNFPHVQVTKDFHVVILSHVSYNSSTHNWNYSSQFALRADSEAVRTPAAENARASYLGINLSTNGSTTGILDGAFTPSGETTPLYTNFDIQAFVSEPASTLSLSSTSHDFGNVVLGSPASFGFKLSNNGASDVTITAVSISQAGTDFTVPTPVPPFLLKAGKSTFVTAGFSPTSEGQQSATATLTMDDGTTLQIGLSGTGEASGVANPGTPSDEALTVVPNPASTVVHFAGIPKAEEQNVELLDLLGRTVLSQKLSAGGTLDVSRLEPGRYEAIVHSASGMVTAPVIIQH